MSDLLHVGDKAPDFLLSDHRNESVSLSAYRGQYVLLWWYPKALTPGCTSCGQGFQKRIGEFYDAGARILGISYDTPAKNYEFAKKNRFVFPLLSGNPELADKYGARKDPGEEFADVPRRISYLIGPDQRIVKTYRVQDATQHPEDVLADLLDLQRAGSRWKFWKR